MADWSSLPSELVRRIANYLLDTNDLDCYMDLRSVCPNWRSATDDPKNSYELRFRPHRWIVIDEVFQSNSRLLVNTVSGRAVRKDLPLLAKYHVVATTHGGFFVLAEKESPHAASVLNPFTGHMIRFKAPVPPVYFSAAALSGIFSERVLLTRSCGASEPRSLPTLILLEDRYTRGQYMAVPDGNSFAVDMDLDKHRRPVPYVLMRLAVSGGICADDDWQRTLAPLSASCADKIFSLMKLFAIDSYRMFIEKPGDFAGTGYANHLFLGESAGDLFAIVKLQQHMKVFRLDNFTGSDELEPVKTIGNRAIFVGYRRCLSVSTDKFPSIAANSVYYLKSTDSSLDIYRYEVETEKEERVSEAIDSLNPSMLSFASPPFDIVQLLSSYTINVWESQLAVEWRKMQDHAMERLQQECLDGYISAFWAPNPEDC